MTYNVLVEGQTIPVPEEIGATDEAVKRALTPYYPEVSNAMITRTVKDEVTTINVVKRAGSKGAAPASRGADQPGLTALIACPGGQNPAIALYQEMQRVQEDGELDPYTMLELDTRIESALADGEAQGEYVASALRRLQQARSRPAGFIVLGF